MCMYVRCVHTVRAHPHPHPDTHINTPTHPHKYTRVYTVAPKSIWGCRKSIQYWISTYIHTDMHTCIHAHIHTYVYTYIHKRMHTCMHGWNVSTPSRPKASDTHLATRMQMVVGMM